MPRELAWAPFCLICRGGHVGLLCIYKASGQKAEEDGRYEGFGDMRLTNGVWKFLLGSLETQWPSQLVKMPPCCFISKPVSWWWSFIWWSVRCVLTLPKFVRGAATRSSCHQEAWKTLGTEEWSKSPPENIWLVLSFARSLLCTYWEGLFSC